MKKTPELQASPDFLQFREADWGRKIPHDMGNFSPYHGAGFIDFRMTMKSSDTYGPFINCRS